MLKHATTLLMVLALLLMTGCASRPGSSTSAVGRDGPEAVIPPDLQKVPNAEPKLEPIRKGGPNKPYEVLGTRYEPMTEDRPLVERGLASWYGKKFHGRPTSSGEIYNMYAMTGAHATMPIPSYARVRNPKNGREIIVRINDRGPFHPGRIIDLSYTAALKLDVLRGVSPVEIERITYDDIRAGLWQKDGQRGADPVPPVFAAAEPVGAPQRETTAQIIVPVDPVVPVIAQPLNTPAPAPRAAAKGFWVQLGAFSKLDGAEAFRGKLVTELDEMAPLLAIFKDNNLHRLQAGPYPTREDARLAAEKVRGSLALTAIVVERK